MGRPRQDYSNGKLCGSCKVFLPLSFYNFHKSGDKIGRPLGKCKSCAKQYQENWIKNINPECAKKISARSYVTNRGKRLTDVERAKRNDWSKAYLKAHPEYARAQTRKRKAIKLKATPGWASEQEILKIYEQAVTLEKESGIKYHVDHIVPLRSRYVCGLHVQDNLQVLDALTNISKNNRFWPDMSDTSDEELKKLAKDFYAKTNPN